MKSHLAVAGIMAAVFGVGVAATSASADGMRPSYKDAPRPFSWTGFYLGGLASYDFTSSTHCQHGIALPCGSNFPVNSVEGGMIGITGGYNHQMGAVVVGVEADWSWGGIRDDATSRGGFGCGTGPCFTELQSLGTVRGRIGYAFGHILPYVTAGAAFTRYHVGIEPFTADHDFTKFVVGGGVEIALGNNVSGKIEYLYIDGGDDAVHSGCGTAPATTCFVRVDELHSIRLGLNYKF